MEQWIYDWLCQHDVRELCLQALQPAWRTQDGLEELAAFRRLAHDLTIPTALWAQALGSDNWRHHLLAGCALLAAQNRSHQDLLERRLARGTMVSPQLAVALGLLHPESCVSFLRSLQHPSVRTAAAAEKVLSYLDPTYHLAPNPRPPGLSAELETWDERNLGREVVERHWEFWKPVVEANR